MNKLIIRTFENKERFYIIKLINKYMAITGLSRLAPEPQNADGKICSTSHSTPIITSRDHFRPIISSSLYMDILIQESLS